MRPLPAPFSHRNTTIVRPTRRLRFAFLLLAANLAWTCPPLGLPVAVATNANALFCGVVLFRHPAFTSGRYGRTEIMDLTSDDVELAPRDPATLARSSALFQ